MAHVNIATTRLVDFALRSLVPMFDNNKQLFCHRLKQTTDGAMVMEGISHRYTIMSLLGVHRAECAGLASPFPIDAIVAALTDTDWILNIGDLGLLLWLNALRAPGRLSSVIRRIAVNGGITSYPGARKRSTTELAWLLSGLSHAILAGFHNDLVLTQLARDVYRLLMRNQGPSGLFGHMASTSIPAGVLRGRIGSFADQVYPIYALSTFAQACADASAVIAARNCAESICRLQGPLGQWWWHYDSVRGVASERYPVYSVHQHGMGPMALFALQQANGVDMTGPIHRGLKWITAINELGIDLRDESLQVIWRSVFHGNPLIEFGRKALGFARLEPQNDPGTDLQLKRECRPYELGWLIYAFAGRPSHPDVAS